MHCRRGRRRKGEVLPIYEYRCLKCGHQFEKMQRISDDAVRRCEKCGEQVTRLFHPVAIRFKGSGFYTTDYGKRGKRTRAKGESRGQGSGKPAAGKKKDSKAAGSKS